MAIFNKRVESAQAAASKAESTLAEWTAKAAASRAEAAELESSSGSLILEDEAQAEIIGLRIQTLERKARAYDQATAEASRKLNDAHREVLEAEAREEDKAAAAARKAAHDHETKVAALLAQLKDVNGCDYAPGRATEGFSAEMGLNQIPRTIEMWRAVKHHEARASAIRYYLSESRIPGDYYEINNVLGTSFDAMASSLADDDGVPVSLRAARDAGLTFQKVAA